MATNLEEVSLSNRPFMQQNSTLMTLPGEIRNQIWEQVAKDTVLVSLKNNKILYCNSLSLVCRQIHSEYRRIYAEEALKHAIQINVHIANFDASNIQLPDLPSPAAGIELEWTLRVLFTDQIWEENEKQRARLQHFVRNYSTLLPTRFALEVFWDKGGFDAQELWGEMQRLKFKVWKASPDGYRPWPEIRMAILGALGKH